jgi:hypothetical protein
MWVYEIKNVVTDKVYVGQTIKSNVQRRWNDHIRELNKNVHVNKNLQNDWNNFGASVFKFNLIKKCISIEELDSLEKTLIKENKKVGISYNISEGGQNSRVVYYKTWKGIKSPDGIIYGTIENMEEFARKYNLDADKLRQVSLGKIYSYKGWTTLQRGKLEKYKTPKGCKMSIESNKKRSISLKKAYTEGRKVAGEKLKKTYNGLISPEGVVHNSVVGLNKFCKNYNLSSGAMSELCSGKKKSYKGWTYNPSATLEN